MLTKITGTPYEGMIKRLRSSQDGELLKRYLQENLSVADEETRNRRDDVDLRRSQGKALTLKAILDLLEA